MCLPKIIGLIERQANPEPEGTWSRDFIEVNNAELVETVAASTREFRNHLAQQVAHNTI